MKLSRSKRNLSGFESLDERLLMTVALFVEASVEQTDNSVSVIAGSTVQNNKIDLVLGTDEHVLTFNDEEYRFNADEVDEFFINSDLYPDPWKFRRTDQVNVTATELDDQITWDGETLTIRSAKYSVQVTSTDTVRVAGGQGFDVAKIYDTDGNDELYMHSHFTALKTSENKVFKVSGAERVHAFAKNGGYDRVSFYDTAGDDRFVGKQNFAYMNGDGFSNYANGFDRYDAHHRQGGHDEAILYDSDGDDTLKASPDQVVFNVGDTVLVTHNYRVTRAIASEGDDKAFLEGEHQIRDVFVWEPESAFLFTTGEPIPRRTGDNRELLPRDPVSNFAVGFDLVRATGSDTVDRADLRGSDKDDTLQGASSWTTLTTPLSKGQTKDFAIVRAFGRGGNDSARLRNNSGWDAEYVDKGDFAYLKGHQPGGVTASIPISFFPGPSYLIYVREFEVVTAELSQFPVPIELNPLPISPKACDWTKDCGFHVVSHELEIELPEIDPGVFALISEDG